ncbi:type II toxin-antitoxin system RelE/ParE family toxin [Patescibacteria group bacterium]|nr:type II toxin-antitoxin system RelE/ParE family toxin [Patescibacteria group bacterium]
MTNKKKYKVIVPQRVKKEFNRIDKKHRRKILLALVALGQDPTVGKKLVGKYKKLWSYRVWPYRIIYEVMRGKLVVLVIRIGHRKDAYK